MVVYEGFENLMQHIVEVAILFFEFVGVIVIIISGLKGFYYYIRRAALTFLIHWEIKQENHNHS